MEKVETNLAETFGDVRNEFVYSMTDLFVGTLSGGVQEKVAILFCIEESRESGLENTSIVECGPM
jgi:hypothetical protein